MKKNSHDTNTGSAVQSFAEQVGKAVADGYMVLPYQGNGGYDKGGSQSHGEMLLNATLCATRTDSLFSGDVVPRENRTVSSSGGVLPTPDKLGTPKKGLVSWGVDNRLPNHVAALTFMLPYPATAAKFNTDVLAGMGFVPKYRYTIVSNGTLVVKEIDYATAGVLLEQQLIDARYELMKFYDEHGAGGSSQHPELLEQVEQTYLKRIERIEEDYNTWQETQQDVSVFMERNNLPLLALNLGNDMVLFNICFPELELSSETTEQPDNAQWLPKVTGISYRSSHTCRMEEMDDSGMVNYIYHSNRWLDNPGVKVNLSDDEMKAIPAINPEHPVSSLKQQLRAFRISNANGSPEDRPTRFILPSYYPSAGHPYYPQPSWWSIFNGDIYGYLYTIVSDRAKRRKNKNIIGYIIYVHTDYLKQLTMQRQQELALANPNRKPGTSLTQQENKQLIDEIFQTINNFIGNRDNAGKPLLAFTFNGTDGKEHDAYRLVEVPNASASDAKAQKTELEEIAGIIAYAMQTHPEVIGQVPGRTGAGGGTYQRELYMLKLLQMAPTQQIILKVLDTITRFNQWDKHLFWTVRQQVLTTLDNSKTGLVESESK